MTSSSPTYSANDHPQILQFHLIPGYSLLMSIHLLISNNFLHRVPNFFDQISLLFLVPFKFAELLLVSESLTGTVYGSSNLHHFNYCLDAWKCDNSRIVAYLCLPVLVRLAMAPVPAPLSPAAKYNAHPGRGLERLVRKGRSNTIHQRGDKYQ